MFLHIEETESSRARRRIRRAVRAMRALAIVTLLGTVALGVAAIQRGLA